MRMAVEAWAAELGGRPIFSENLAAEGVAEAARSLVSKVAQHAYRVTDDDIDALRSAGYSEDAIFELTVSAALGAGCGRLERGLSALRGEI